ncbi:heme-dependent oxidative N-demethylase subunit alpha family protein [uncultured Piscinibacter sp.]|uniref:heme-dependent oxidative N-demethylase subunit alpha family protein n=1 Tax=uncultured Piscinibacter sp. TaxID=1131835 RepID=UPI0026236B58|nr:heme-dependent oxidative N-demethylase subunit alpha family protein [uncultured Piscinibacter sp.]
MPFDFAAVTAPFRMQPGLRALTPGASQLTPSRPGDRALGEKLVVLRDHAAQALVVAPGFDAEPALRRLSEHAAAEHPQAWCWDGQDRLDAPLLGWSLRGDTVVGDGPAAIGRCLSALPAPWRRAALLCLAFAEDFAVVDGATARIPWLAVCLPSHWSPEDKVGRHFAEVHAPVADNRLLLSASEHLTRLVTGNQRWERFVWTITPEPRLDMHPQRVGAPRWPADADAESLVAGASFRTERQTFIPLPERRQAIFTIHVESRPLDEAIRAPGQAAAVHDALASMSEAVLAYRGLGSARDRLLAWLAARTA